MLGKQCQTSTTPSQPTRKEFLRILNAGIATVCIGSLMCGGLWVLRTHQELEKQKDATAQVKASLVQVQDEVSDLQMQLSEAEVQAEAFHTENEAIREQLLELEALEMFQDECVTYAGNFVVTAYCPCSKCCGKHANNRPVVRGETIVFTAIGEVAQEGVTVAVDPSVIPYGTAIYIEGVGIRYAQDCGVSGKRLDVYYEDHSEALHSGLSDRPRGVWIIG